MSKANSPSPGTSLSARIASASGSSHLYLHVLRTANRFFDCVAQNRPDDREICQHAKAYVKALRRYRHALFSECLAAEVRPSNRSGCRRRRRTKR